MSQDDRADERAARANYERSLQEMEAAAAEIVEVGDLSALHASESRACIAFWTGAFCGAARSEDRQEALRVRKIVVGELEDVGVAVLVVV